MPKDKPLVPLSGDAYWALLKKTADKVAKWPDWKRGK